MKSHFFYSGLISKFAVLRQIGGRPKRKAAKHLRAHTGVECGWKSIVVTILLGLLFALPASAQLTTVNDHNNTEVAIFAGGCFWCMQPPYDKTLGVLKSVAGYTGGHTKNPTYKQVSSADTGHYEAVAIYYNPKKISYDKLLTIFWHNIDPTDASGQFCDKGNSYRSAIFYSNANQKQIAEVSKQELIKSGKFSNIATKIMPATTFYPAEEYHQNYYKKNPLRYKFYRFHCGRDQRLKELWG